MKKLGCGKDESWRNTGPRTAVGKRIASKNAWKHGYFSREISQLHLCEEDQQEYQAQVDGFIQHCNPEGPVEWALVELMSHQLYNYKRLCRSVAANRDSYETELDVSETSEQGERFKRWRSDLPDLEELERFQRFEAHILKTFFRLHGELDRLQARRRGEPVGPRLTVDINK
jgi:hypothetical protein